MIYSNNLLNILSDIDCEIILSSDLLYEYIKSKYPNIKLVASVIKSIYETTQNIDETEYINSLLAKYDRVVIRSEYFLENKNKIKLLNNLNKIELLVNQNCAYNCLNSKAHYALFEKYNRGKLSYSDVIRFAQNICPRFDNPNVKLNTLGHSDVVEAINLGITNLKLQGRMLPFDAMIKELYQHFFNDKYDYEFFRSKIYEEYKLK